MSGSDYLNIYMRQNRQILYEADISGTSSEGLLSDNLGDATGRLFPILRSSIEPQVDVFSDPCMREEGATGLSLDELELLVKVLQGGLRCRMRLRNVK